MSRENTIKLSNEEFNSSLTNKKLGFQLVESARLVLVQGVEPTRAADIVGINRKSDVRKIDNIVEQIVKSHQDLQKTKKGQ